MAAQSGQPFARNWLPMLGGGNMGAVSVLRVSG